MTGPDMGRKVEAYVSMSPYQAVSSYFLVQEKLGRLLPGQSGCHKCITISEVAFDWHQLMVEQFCGCPLPALMDSAVTVWPTQKSVFVVFCLL